MIRYIVGYKGSGVGLLKRILSRSTKVDIVEVPEDTDLPMGFVPADNTIYFVSGAVSKSIQLSTECLVVFRCPLSCFLYLINSKEYDQFRLFGDEEIDYHLTMFIRDLISSNSIVESGGVFFVMRLDGMLLDRLNGLCMKLVGERLATQDDVNTMLEAASFQGRFQNHFDFSSKIRKGTERMIGMYSKYNLDSGI